MNFKKFIIGYVKFILGLLAIAFMIAPVVLGIYLATFSYAEFMWLILLVVVTFPIGLYMILKLAGGEI